MMKGQATMAIGLAIIVLGLAIMVGGLVFGIVKDGLK